VDQRGDIATGERVTANDHWASLLIRRFVFALSYAMTAQASIIHLRDAP